MGFHKGTCLLWYLKTKAINWSIFLLEFRGFLICPNLGNHFSPGASQIFALGRKSPPSVPFLEARMKLMNCLPVEKTGAQEFGSHKRRFDLRQ
jgi:hypothetical protein